MTFYRANPGGWTDGDQLTSAQLSIMDAQASLALRKGDGTYVGPFVFDDLTVNGDVLYSASGWDGVITKPVVTSHPLGSNGTWVNEAGGVWLFDSWAQNDIASNNQIAFSFRLPHKSTFKGCTVRHNPPSHGGSTSFTRVRAALAAIDSQTGLEVASIVGLQADVTAYASYDTEHSFTVLPTDDVEWQHYWIGRVTILGEYNAGGQTAAAVGGLLKGITTSFLPYSLDQRRST